MKLISDDQAREWCRSKSMNIIGHHNLQLDSPTPYVLKLHFPNEIRDLILQAFRLSGFKQDKPYDATELSEEEGDYEGALLWLTRWNIWNEKSERFGNVILQCVRAGLGQNVPFDRAPGHLFAAGEYADQAALLAIILMCEWDAYLVPESAKYFIRLSHEGSISAVSRTRDIHEQLMYHLRAWNPVSDSIR
jgi:hypothetical protein